MADRLTTSVDDFVAKVAPVLRRHTKPATAELDALAPTRVDEGQPTFRLMRVEWREVTGTSGFEAADPQLWPVYRCTVASDLVLGEEAAWDAESMAHDMASRASLALSRGLGDALWRGARAEHVFPTLADTLRKYVDELGGRAVLVVAADVDADLAPLVDEVKKVPSGWMPGKGYLRASVGGPSVELVEADWQVGWDRVDDHRARLVASRTARLVRVDGAFRLVAKV